MLNSPLARPLRLTLLMPVRDDWPSAAVLIRSLEKALSPYPCAVEILVVDDGSIQRGELGDFQGPFSAIQALRILRLRRNVGHQRAIAIGLAFLEQASTCDAVLVMDADGEDTPEGVVDLLQGFCRNGGTSAIFAERRRRTENLVFRSFYLLYRMLHLALTGIAVRVGNFSMLPRAYLSTLVVMNELWNHYAAAVFRSRLPFTTVPIARGRRIAGKPKMNFVALVIHGLSAMSVFGDIIGARILITSLVGSALAGLGIAVAVGIRLLTDRAIPGWTTYATGSLAIIMMQFISIAASFTFFMLASRSNSGFLPIRDCSSFVAEVRDIYPHE